MTDVDQRPGQCTHDGCTDDAHYDAPTTTDERGNTTLTGRHIHCYRHRLVDVPERPTPTNSPGSMPVAFPEFARRLARSALRLEHAAAIAQQALEHAAHELALADDSMPTQTPGAAPLITEPYVNRCRYCATVVQAPTGEMVSYSPGCEQCQPIQLTPVERAAEQRRAIAGDIREVTDDLINIESLTSSLNAMLHRLARTRIDLGRRCDGTPIPSHTIRWIPHSRHPNNGWYDPTCTRPAVRNGLCEPCSKRHDRYTADHEVVQTEPTA